MKGEKIARDLSFSAGAADTIAVSDVLYGIVKSTTVSRESGLSSLIIRESGTIVHDGLK